MGKFKLIGSDAQRVFIRKLVDEGISQVNSEYGVNNELSNHQINSIMNFIETKIYYSNYSKEKFDKKKILYLILNGVYPEKYTEEMEDKMVEEAVRFIIDHDMIKIHTKNFFLKYGAKIIKTAIDLIL